MDFDSPEVEKDFPGFSKKGKEESDYSDGETNKKDPKKRKDKKDKGKDRGYAALEGESSPEEELDAKSPSKSKKSKTFKFTSSKSKEKREKSRDKDKTDKDAKEEEKLKEKPDKKKDKRDKTEKKEKDKKDKKLKHTASGASEEVLELGDLQPVFGVSVSLATERSRCHDGIDLPLVVRDCIDFLQEHGLKNEHIYKVEPVKTRLQHFKRLYNNRERYTEAEDFDVPTACGLLKLFLRELPEPILTTDLIARFEDVAAHTLANKQLEEFRKLLELLPSCNLTLLSWILLHFEAIVHNEKTNKLNAQSLAMLLSPPLNMSHRLLVALLSHCSNLFAKAILTKYIPPITPSSPNLPETREEIQAELSKQESLLAQIHAEMNAGFVSKKREELLWEVQRIITQLKRKLRSFEKKHEKSIEETLVAAAATVDATDSAKQGTSSLQAGKPTNQQKKLSCSDDESIKTAVTAPSSDSAVTTGSKNTPQHDANDQTAVNSNNNSLEFQQQNPDILYIDEHTGLLMLPQSHADYATLIRLQLENRELLSWKVQLQSRISTERAEILRLKQLHQQQRAANGHQELKNTTENSTFEDDFGQIVEKYIKENALLEHKKSMLAKQIFEERRELLALQVELNMQQFKEIF